MQADGDVVGNGANERRSGSDQKDGSVTFWSKTERGIKQNYDYSIILMTQNPGEF